MLRLIWMFALGAILSGCATGRTISQVIMPGSALTSEQVSIVTSECATGAAAVRAPHQNAYVNYAGGSGAIIGGLIGQGLIQGYSDGQARRVALEQCLLSRGFVPIMLSPEDYNAYQALPEGEQRMAFLTPRLPEAERVWLEAGGPDKFSGELTGAAETPAPGAATENAAAVAPAPKHAQSP